MALVLSPSQERHLKKRASVLSGSLPPKVLKFAEDATPSSQSSSDSEVKLRRFVLRARNDDNKLDQLGRILSWRSTGLVYIYCSSYDRAEWLASVIRSFTARPLQVVNDPSKLEIGTGIVITSSLSRSPIPHVIFFDMPETVEGYLSVTSNRYLRSIFLIVQPDYCNGWDMDMLSSIETIVGTNFSVLD